MDHNTLGPGNRTKSITPFDPAILSHDLGAATLDIAFVEQVLRETGPVFPPQHLGHRSFSFDPGHLPTEALAEPAYYPWMNWALRGRSFHSRIPGPAGCRQPIINEMTAGHAIICTQDQYVMKSVEFIKLANRPRRPGTWRSWSSFTRMRPCVSERDTPSPSRPRHFYTMPAFPVALFQPYHGVVRESGLRSCTKLILLRKPRPSLLPLPWARFDGDVQSDTGRNDGTIAHGRVLFFFLAARRLHREFRAYAALRALQGTEIPKVVGLYRREEDNSTVLLIPYAGTPLKSFADLDSADRRTLFWRLLRLHQRGFEFEPRNVTIFGSSNPVIVDFDHASLGHACTGVACGELGHVAEVLGLDRLSSRANRDASTPVSHHRDRSVLRVGACLGTATRVVAVAGVIGI
ncbi:hypothetical protein B0H12DRAFT_1074035 [Mycena haematopus]|nr:hypothetical protein B0H12DRAFT_1074035 [Mycena haematopus]